MCMELIYTKASAKTRECVPNYQFEGQSDFLLYCVVSICFVWSACDYAWLCHVQVPQGMC